MWPESENAPPGRVAGTRREGEWGCLGAGPGGLDATPGGAVEFEAELEDWPARRATSRTPRSDGAARNRNRALSRGRTAPGRTEARSCEPTPVPGRPCQDRDNRCLIAVTAPAAREQLLAYLGREKFHGRSPCGRDECGRRQRPLPRPGRPAPGDSRPLLRAARGNPVEEGWNGSGREYAAAAVRLRLRFRRDRPGRPGRPGG